MGFFDDIAREPDDGVMRPARPARAARMPPIGEELPTPVAMRLMLVRTEQVAVAVIGVWAYTTGFELVVSVALKDEIPGESVASFMAAADEEPLDDDEFCRLGIAFSTGEKAVNTEPETSSRTSGPIMKVRSGGGSLLSREWRYWISPLPPPGPLAFVIEWPYFGVSESRTEIDAQPILDAASQSIVLWT
jgi:hypothetical protein